MRDQRHTGGGSRILAVCGGNDDGAQSQGHGEIADHAVFECFGQGENFDKHQEYDGNGDQTDEGDDVDGDVGKGLLQVDLGNGHTRQQHGNGRHTVAQRRGRVCQEGRELQTRQADDHTDDHADEHGIDKGTELIPQRFALALHGDEQAGRTPGVDQRPEGEDEDQIFHKNIGEEGGDDGVAHKAEVGEDQAVGVNITDKGILGAGAGDQDAKGDGDDQHGRAADQIDPCRANAFGCQIGHEGAHDESGDKDVVLHLGERHGSGLGYGAHADDDIADDDEQKQKAHLIESG